MYKQFYGLQKEPFQMTPDPAFLFLTSGHREALAGLTYALLQKKGFIVLTGGAGTGKTTLLAKVLGSIPLNRLQSSIILNSTVEPAELLEMALLDFGIADVPPGKARRLALLQQFLLRGNREGKISALIIDEAHKLSTAVLEEIRLLSNFEFADQKLLQIVLIGQPELRDVLNREELSQLKQRIAVRLSTEPLAPAAVEQYVVHRWQTAGGGPRFPFQPDAVQAIARNSGGIPRVINAICDNALLLVYGEQAVAVAARHVLEVCRDLDLGCSPVPRNGTNNGPKNGIPLPLTPIAISGLSTLQRYGTEASKPSLWSRWTGRRRAVRLGKSS